MTKAVPHLWLVLIMLIIILVIIIIIIIPVASSSVSGAAPFQHFLFDFVHKKRREKERGGRRRREKNLYQIPFSEALNAAGHYLTGAFVRPIQERTKWLFRGTL